MNPSSCQTFTLIPWLTGSFEYLDNFRVSLILHFISLKTCFGTIQVTLKMVFDVEKLIEL